MTNIDYRLYDFMSQSASVYILEDFQPLKQNTTHMFYVSYMRAHCVKVFDKEGVFISNIGRKGCGEGQLRYPEGLCVDSFGNLIVCDASSIDENLRDGVLKMFTLDETFLTSFSENTIKVPLIVSRCNNGDLLVADLVGDNVHILR